MRRITSVFVLVFFSFTICYAQNRASGVSKPGSLMRRAAVTESTSKKGIVCEISYSDPSGDNMLSEGETGTIKVVPGYAYGNITLTPSPKEIGDMYFYVEEIRTRREKLALKTFYKKPIKE